MMEGELQEIKAGVTVPVWLAWVFATVVVLLLAGCWWLSLTVSNAKAYELGKFVESRQNPARQYVEDGVPFVWYKGTFYRVQYVKPKMFRALE